MKSKKIIKAIKAGKKNIKGVKVLKVNSKRTLIYWNESNMFYSITLKNNILEKLEIFLNGEKIKKIKF